MRDKRETERLVYAADCYSNMAQTGGGPELSTKRGENITSGKPVCREKIKNKGGLLNRNVDQTDDGLVGEA